jgi:hypothetical protein
VLPASAAAALSRADESVLVEALLPSFASTSCSRWSSLVRMSHRLSVLVDAQFFASLSWILPSSFVSPATAFWVNCVQRSVSCVWQAIRYRSRASCRRIRSSCSWTGAC